MAVADKNKIYPAKLNERKARSTSADMEFGTHWPSLSLCFASLLFVGIQYSIYLTSLWPYMSQIDKTADESFYGWTIAAFSIGQFLASPIFGWFSTKFRTTKIPIVIGLVINVVANLNYSSVELMSEDSRKWFLLFGRLASGVGSGVSSVYRAYISEASSPKDRVKATSIGTGCMSIGFMVGPGIQALTTPIGYPGVMLGPFHFDMYTVPGYLCAAVAALLLVLMVTCFRENYLAVYNAKADNDPFVVLPKMDKIAVAVLLWTWAAVLIGFVMEEAIGSPLTMAMFSWNRAEAVGYNGLIFMMVGAAGVVMYLLIGAVFKQRFDKRLLMLVGFGLLLSYYIISFPYPGLPPMDIQKQLNETKQLDITPQNPNATVISGPSNPSNTSSISSHLPTSSDEGDETELLGCNPKFAWCFTTPKIYFAQYIAGQAMTAFGIPLANSMISVLFSLVVGPRRQGTMQGLFTMSGSLARMVGPVIASTLFSMYGPRATWGMAAAILSSTMVLILLTWKRLVPLNPKPALKPGECFEYKRGTLYRL